MRKKEQPLDYGFVLGKALSEIDRLKEDLAEFNGRVRELETLKFWNLVLKTLLSVLGALVALIAAVFWRHPELWLKLVELLK